MWHLISFSSPGNTIPTTKMFTLIRYMSNKKQLDAPCGSKLVSWFASNNVLISTGSACNKGSDHTGHVLQALGVPEKFQQSAIRVSFCDTAITHYFKQFTGLLE